MIEAWSLWPAGALTHASSEKLVCPVKLIAVPLMPPT